MANLKDSPKFSVHDDYYTPYQAWEQISHLIPDDKVIWEACMLNAPYSRSGFYLKELGKKVIWDSSYDCLKGEYVSPYDTDGGSVPTGFDMIVTNPPFDSIIKIEILKKFVSYDKPFIIIMNSMNTFTKYMRVIVKIIYHNVD
jgi:hypothetical protein